MSLWVTWYEAIIMLRPAFSRERTFLWFMVCVAGLSIREDKLGVSSIVRSLRLMPKKYSCLLDCCHSTAVNIDQLTTLWFRCVLKLWCYKVVTVNDRIVLIADGKKIAKSGKKMPGVKKLHQESDDNTKPSFIMGHSTQQVGVLCVAGKTWFCVPLLMKIHEGIKRTNRDKRTLFDKLLEALLILNAEEVNYYLVADAYYGNGKITRGLLANGNHLVTRAKSNFTAFHKPPPVKKNQRGRPRKYGTSVKVNDLFNSTLPVSKVTSPIYGEEKVKIQIRTVDLLWKPAGGMVRFVLVKHPTRGKIVLMCTDTELDPVAIVRLYGARFKIELGFKQASQVIGSYAYHFWMADMKPLRRFSGTQYLHRQTEAYRKAVERKMNTYHFFLAMGVVAQGLMQYLSAVHTDQTWSKFGSWLRTIRQGVPPSEMVVSIALRNNFDEFLAVGDETNDFAKFIAVNQDTDLYSVSKCAA